MRVLHLFLSLILLTTTCFGQYLKPIRGMPFVNRTHRLARGLVGHWLFNEGSGNKVFDLSGNGVEAVFVNSPTWVPEGLNFQGTSHLLLPTGFGNNLEKAGTIVCGLDVRGTGDGAIFDSRVSNNEGWDLGLFDGNWQFQIDTGDVVTQIVAASVGDSFVALTYDGSTQKAYVNGTEVASDANSGDATESGQSKIGNILNDERPLGSDKTLKWIYFYNRGLSASEIAELYREPFGMFQKDNTALIASAEAPPPPTGGQVIMITSAIPVILILAICLTIGRIKHNPTRGE